MSAWGQAFWILPRHSFDPLDGPLDDLGELGEGTMTQKWGCIKCLGLEYGLWVLCLPGDNKTLAHYLACKVSRVPGTPNNIAPNSLDFLTSVQVG